MLKSLGVSRSGYRAFLNRKVLPTRQRKTAVKKQIQHIYDDSNQNYGAPKITKELQKSGECISQHTVGKYMREMGIKAQWVKPWTTTTRDSDFSKELEIPKSTLLPILQTLCQKNYLHQDGNGLYGAGTALFSLGTAFSGCFSPAATWAPSPWRWTGSLPVILTVCAAAA